MNRFPYIARQFTSRGGSVYMLKPKGRSVRAKCTWGSQLPVRSGSAAPDQKGKALAFGSGIAVEPAIIIGRTKDHQHPVMNVAGQIACFGLDDHTALHVPPYVPVRPACASTLSGRMDHYGCCRATQRQMGRTFALVAPSQFAPGNSPFPGRPRNCHAKRGSKSVLLDTKSVDRGSA